MKTKVTYFLTFVFVFAIPLVFAQAQTMQISGTVTDEDGVPIPGVNITIEGGSAGTSTDFDGNYSISTEQGETLVFTSIGFQDQDVVVGSDATINVSMVQGTALDEVILVGYGQTTKQSFTGSVKSIDAEKLVSKNVSNAAEALKGEVAGVNIINNTGQPGEAPTIRIRGFGSVNGNRDPLLVVDGVPFTGTLSNINPDDIETMSVLKDATATAIYGSRGANGVVLVTTKKGKSGTSTITASYKMGTNFQLLPRYQTISSPEEYVGLSWEGFANQAKFDGSGNDPVAFANANLFSSQSILPKYNIWDVDDVADLIDPNTGKVRDGVSRIYNPEDWEKEAFSASVRSEANLNFSGGGDRTTYYASFGYLKDKGYSVNSDYNRYTMRLNLNQGITDWLDGSLNMGYSISKSNQNGQSSDSGSIFWFVDNIPPIYPLFLRDENGNRVEDPIYGGYQYDYGDGRGFGGLTNAVGDAHYNLNRQKEHAINVSNSFTAKLYDGLTFETRLGLEYSNNNLDNISNPFYGSAASSNGGIFKRKDERLAYNFSQILRYNKKFGDHQLEAFAAHEINSWEMNYMNGSKSNIVIPGLPELNNGVKSDPSHSYQRKYTLESYFGQINYNYDNRYFFSGTLRRDGSSRFTKENKWGTFGSVGLAWEISSEEFMSNVDWLDHLKLKTSFGETGEQNGVGYYPAPDLYDVNNLNNEISLSFNTKGNPDLTWETSQMFQVGVEFGIGSFIDASVDYYIKNTKNLLFDRRVAPSEGYALITVNDGKLRNSGLEFDITAHVLQGKDYFLDVNLNGTTIKNELTEMPIDPATGDLKVLDVDGQYGRSKGHSLYDFYMREWAGVDSETGEGMWNRYFDKATGETITSLADFKASNPDAEIGSETTKDYQEATRKYVGKSAIPDLQGGFGINAGYKNFSLGVQFTYGIGGSGYDFVYSRLMDNGVPGSNNWHQDIRNRWQKPGDITDVPRLSADLDKNVAGSSTRFLLDKSFLNLGNVRLGYTLPENWISKLKMSNFEIFVSGTNLALINKRKGYDPTTSQAGESDWYTYNPLSTVTGGVSIKF